MKSPVRPVWAAGNLRRVKISGLSTYVPPKLLTNDDLEKLVDTTNEGSSGDRHQAAAHREPGVATSDLAKEARRALRQAGIHREHSASRRRHDTRTRSSRAPGLCNINRAAKPGFDMGAAFRLHSRRPTYQMCHRCARSRAVVGRDVMRQIDYRARTTAALRRRRRSGRPRC